MIQVYSPQNKDYEKNGDMTLFPKQAFVNVVLNGSWQATLNHPIDAEGRWKYLEEEAVVKMPSFNGNQLFRIRKASKRDSGVTCTMEPIFYDSIDDCFLTDVRPTQKNGHDALNIMLSPNAKYKGESDITKVSTAYYEYKNFMEALNGDNEQSFINRWGGEILFDNFTVIVNERVGGDYGVELLYGKNIKRDGLTEEVDTRDVITRIYPVAFNGRKPTYVYVDSENIGKYPTIRQRTMKFEDVKLAEDLTDGATEEDGVTICSTQEELDAVLLAKCQEQFVSGIDKPKVTITADMILLQNTEQYKDFQILETVSLGDTIHCKHSKLDIITDARVIELEYDSIRKKVASVVLGDFKYDYFDDISSSADKIEQIVRPNGTVMAEKVRGILNAMNTQLKYQKDVARKQDVRAILFEDLDPDSNTYGAMCLGTQGFQISNKRTADGRDWDWSTAATAKGLNAATIITGLLSDKTGNNYWNLDTGEFKMSSTAKVEDTTFDKYVQDKAEESAKEVQGNVDSLAKRVTTAETSISNNAKEIKLKASQTTVDALSGQVTNAEASIKANATAITSKVSKGSVSSEISQEAEKVTIKGNRLVIEADNFKLKENGDLEVCGKYTAKSVRRYDKTSFTLETATRARQIAGGYEFDDVTQEELDSYDLYGDGFDLLDAILMMRLASNYYDWYEITTEIAIDPTGVSPAFKAVTYVQDSTNGVVSQKTIRGQTNISGTGMRTPSIVSDAYTTYDNDNMEQKGATGTYTSADGKTIIVVNGIVVGI